MPSRYRIHKLTEAYCEGRMAARKGRTLSDNPFADGIDDDASVAWLEGFASWGEGEDRPRDSGLDIGIQVAVEIYNPLGGG